MDCLQVRASQTHFLVFVVQTQDFRRIYSASTVHLAVSLYKHAQNNIKYNLSGKLKPRAEQPRICEGVNIWRVLELWNIGYADNDNLSHSFHLCYKLSLSDSVYHYRSRTRTKKTCTI